MKTRKLFSLKKIENNNFVELYIKKKKKLKAVKFGMNESNL